jgi:adenylate cyclase
MPLLQRGSHAPVPSKGCTNQPTDRAFWPRHCRAHGGRPASALRPNLEFGRDTERFDRDQHEIFAVQDQVVRTIVGTIAGRVEASGVEHARRKPPANLMAYDYVLRGNALPVGDVAAEAEARRMYEKAIELDPTYGLAYGLLAYVISLERLRDKTTAPAAFDQALELAMKGVQCDDTSSDCHTVLGWVHLNRRDFDLAERCYMQAIDLNPNNPLCIAGLAEWLNYVGRPEEALAVFKQVKQINPHFNPAWWWRTLGVVHFNARQYDLSVADFSRASSNEVWSLCYIAACHGYLARSESAAELVAEILRLAPDFSSRWLLAKEPYKRVADQEHLLKGLRKAGLPD